MKLALVTQGLELELVGSALFTVTHCELLIRDGSCACDSRGAFKEMHGFEEYNMTAASRARGISDSKRGV